MADFTALIIAGIAALWDIRTGRIPNLITMPALVFGIIINIYYSGLAGLGMSMSGLAAGFLLLIILYVMGAMGAGDVKLLAAIGALVGPMAVLYVFLYTAAAGGLIALGLLFIRRQWKDVLFNMFLSIQSLSVNSLLHGQRQKLPASSGIKFPYGIAIFIGTAAEFILR